MSDLKYRTFDSLMNSVKKRLHIFSDNNLIKDANYISVATGINSELGIKINQQREGEIDVENFRASLPDDCMSILGAVAIVGKEDCEAFDHNFNLEIHAENHLLKHSKKYIKYYGLVPTRRALNRFSKDSINRRCRSQYQIDVDDRELTFNFKQGKIVIAYIAEMVDEEGNLLVIDHPLINKYYESAITAEVLKDMWYNMDADTYNKYQNENQGVLPALKTKANGIVNFPGYRKLREHNDKINREYYNKFYALIV